VCKKARNPVPIAKADWNAPFVCTGILGEGRCDIEDAELTIAG
jgi:hypothetical protein